MMSGTEVMVGMAARSDTAVTTGMGAVAGPESVAVVETTV